MKDWKKIAAGSGLPLNDSDAERVTKPLEGLEAVFRPLAQSLAPLTDPATVFHTSEQGRTSAESPVSTAHVAPASSVELTTAALARIAEGNPRLNAFVTVTADAAMASARRADEELARGIIRGPLHGVPVAVKDLFYTRGVRTTGGSTLFENFVPEFDAAVVERLESAGAVLVGKTGLHELAYGVTSNNPHFGAVRNPHDPKRSPGGSSGGSGAAVAAGMVRVAMGSDTGGSIRIPASFCGVVGLKPTYGRVSKYGVMPLGFTLDHMGPLAKTVRAAAAALQAIAGYDPRDDSTSRRPVENYIPPPECSIRGLRVGVPRNFYFDRVQPAVAGNVRRAIALAESLGAEVRELEVPDIPALNAVARVILLAEAPAALEPWLERRDEIGADVLALLDQGRLIPGADYVNAQRIRRAMQREFDSLFESVDCLFTPTTPNTAPEIGQTTVEFDGEAEDVRLAATRFVRAINALGLPAISIPCGNDAAALPVGLQIIGRPFEEALILRAAAALEHAL